MTGATVLIGAAVLGPTRAAAAEVYFSAPTTLSTSPNPVSVAVSDFNGDSLPDLAVASASSDDVSVRLGGMGASFGAATSYPAGRQPSLVAVGDFNGDSDPDLAVPDLGTHDVSILTGGPGGSFGPRTSFIAGNYADDVAYATSAAVGDFNGDSDPDLAVTNSGVHTVSIAIGGPGASFGSFSSLQVGDRPQSVAIGDFNGDSRPDLAVANYNSHNVSVLLGGPDGGFGAAADVSIGRYPDVAFPRSVALGDFNGDSDPDLVVANSATNNVSVLLGGPGGSFGAATTYAVGGFPSSVAVGDFNGDSDPDLVVANSATNNVSVLLGGPGGNFSRGPDFAVGSRPQSVAVGDFNGDSDPDLAVANFGSADVSVLLGAVEPAKVPLGPSAPTTTPSAPTPTPAAPSAGRITADLTRSVLARQVGRLISVRASGALINLRGRPCGGKVAVAVTLSGKRGARHVVKLNSACRYTTTLRIGVKKLPKRLRSRDRRLRARVTTAYSGTTEIRPARLPAMLTRVSR